MSKGSQIGASGRLQVRNYDAQDGQKRYVTEVVADEITFLSSANRKESTGGYQQAPAPRADNNMSAMGLDEDFHLMADDDDVPF